MFTLRMILARSAMLLFLLAVYWGTHTTAEESTGTGTTESSQSSGLVGDGTADDTAALQKWINQSPGHLALPPGRYRLTQPLVVELDSVGPFSISGQGVATLVMEGAGPALRIIGTHGGTADPKTVKQHVWDRQRMPLIDGLEIVGRHEEACGIELVETMQPTITRVTVRDALHAIHLVKRNRNVQISDCHLYDNRGIGVYLDGVNLHQINITGGHISYNDQGGIVCRDSEIRNLQIVGSDIEGNMSPETDPTANILLDCRTGSVREGSIVGCTIQHNRHSPESANIRFLGQSAENPLKVGNFTISHNVLSDVRTNIHLQYARGVTITGNTFWEGFDHNLLVEGSEYIVLGPNLFDRNPDYRNRESTNKIVFRDCRDCTVTGLHVNDTTGKTAGVTLERCDWFQFTDSFIVNCETAGLRLADCENCRIAGCIIRPADNADGLVVEGGQGLTFDGNIVSGTRSAQPMESTQRR